MDTGASSLVQAKEKVKEEDNMSVKEEFPEPVDLDMLAPQHTEQAMPNLKHETNFAKVKEHLQVAFDQVCVKYGSPVQYLARKYLTATARKDFRDELLQRFHLCPSLNYVTPGTVCKNDKGLLHISNLGYEAHLSTKGPPHANVCRDLVDEFLVHGFLTESEPLTLWISQSDREMSMEEYRSRFVKGAARSATLLALLDMAFERNVDVHVVFPRLFQTAQVIHVVFETHAGLVEVAFANANKSIRGQIRAPHDILTWVQKLRMLTRDGNQEVKSIFSLSLSLSLFLLSCTFRYGFFGKVQLSVFNLKSSTKMTFWLQEQNGWNSLK